MGVNVRRKHILVYEVIGELIFLKILCTYYVDGHKKDTKHRVLIVGGIATEQEWDVASPQ